MANEKEKVGPVDEVDPEVQVASVRPTPSGSDLVAGTTAGTVRVELRFTAPLVLAGEPRIEVYESTAPDGTVVVVTHNLDTGEMSYQWTERKVATLMSPAVETVTD